MTTQTYYHIYNHAIGDEIFFREQTNYEFFLKQVEKYLIGEIKLHAYVLMPNHFHLMVSINEGMEEQAFHQLSKLFNSYAKAYNKFYSRRGSLFIKIFKRDRLDTIIDVKRTMLYIHRNPLHHGFTSFYHVWQYSSYIKIIDPVFSSKLIDKDLALNLFGGIGPFLLAHENYKH